MTFDDDFGRGRYLNSGVGLGIEWVDRSCVDRLKLGLHEISNPSSTEYAMSLHLYTPPNAATRGCRVYEKGDGSMKHVMQGEWHSVGGKLVRK